MKNERQSEWIEVQVQAKPSYLEILSAFIFATHAQGIRETENGFSIYYAADDWNPEIQRLLFQEFQRVIPNFDAQLWHVQGQKNEDWLHNWKDNFKPFHLTDSLVIQPDWEHYRPRSGETVLTIAPKMAFGTGHHESTQLCLFLMDDFLKPGMHVLDVGAGSGILSIYAKIKGADRVLGLDNDPVTVENARENLLLNGINSGVEFRVAQAQEVAVADFDLVLANINRNILLQIAPRLRQATKAGGVLILSGILAQDRSLMIKAFATGAFKLVGEKKKNEWIGLAFEKKAEANA